jgi:hypothetical protein
MPRKKSPAKSKAKLPEFPLIPLRDTVLFPRLMSPIMVSRTLDPCD